MHTAEEVGDGIPLDGTAFQQDAAEPFSGFFLNSFGLLKLGGRDVASLAQ